MSRIDVLATLKTGTQDNFDSPVPDAIKAFHEASQQCFSRLLQNGCDQQNAQTSFFRALTTSPIQQFSDKQYESIQKLTGFDKEKAHRVLIIRQELELLQNKGKDVLGSINRLSERVRNFGFKVPQLPDDKEVHLTKRKRSDTLEDSMPVKYPRLETFEQFFDKPPKENEIQPPAETKEPQTEDQNEPKEDSQKGEGETFNELVSFGSSGSDHDEDYYSGDDVELVPLVDDGDIFTGDFVGDQFLEEFSDDYDDEASSGDEEVFSDDIDLQGPDGDNALPGLPGNNVLPDFQGDAPPPSRKRKRRSQDRNDPSKRNRLA